MHNDILISGRLSVTLNLNGDLMLCWCNRPLEYLSILSTNCVKSVTAYSSSEIQWTALHRTLQAELSTKGSCDWV